MISRSAVSSSLGSSCLKKLPSGSCFGGCRGGWGRGGIGFLGGGQGGGTGSQGAGCGCGGGVGFGGGQGSCTRFRR